MAVEVRVTLELEERNNEGTTENTEESSIIEKIIQFVYGTISLDLSEDAEKYSIAAHQRITKAVNSLIDILEAQSENQTEKVTQMKVVYNKLVEKSASNERKDKVLWVDSPISQIRKKVEEQHKSSAVSRSWTSSEESYEQNNRAVQDYLTDLIGVPYKHPETPKSGRQNDENSYKLEDARPINEKDETDAENGRDYMGELYLWSLLNWDMENDIGLSLRLWTRTKEPLSAALFAHRIFQELASKQTALQPHYEHILLQEYTKIFENLALEVLDTYYFNTNAEMNFKVKSNENQTFETKVEKSHQFWTQDMLFTKSRNWGNKSPFSFADEATNMKIIAHVASWTYIRDTWFYGNFMDTITSERSLLRKVLDASVPFVICLLYVISFISFLCVYSYVMLNNFHICPLRSANESGKSVVWEEVFLMLYVIGMTFEEIKQIIQSFKRKSSYFNNKWNLLQMASIFTYFIGIILQHIVIDYSFEAARIFRSFSLILFYYQLLLHLCVFKAWGIFMPVLFALVKEFIKFIVILALVIAAYTVGMQALINPNSTHSSRTHDLNNVVLNQIYYMFGSLDEPFLEGTDTFQKGWTNTTFPMSVSKDWVYPIGKIVQLVLTNFILLNFLIALFNFKYEDIQKKAELHYKFEFYQLTREYTFHTWLPPPLCLLGIPMIFMEWKWNPFNLNDKENDDFVYTPCGKLRVMISCKDLTECANKVRKTMEEDKDENNCSKYTLPTWMTWDKITINAKANKLQDSVEDQTLIRKIDLLEKKIEYLITRESRQ